MKYDYPFTNSIVFALVMRDSERCRQLLQMIFPEREIKEVKLHEEYLDTEHTIIVGIESRKVRLDVMFTDSDAWYDIEMQVESRGHLPKRTRYAHSIVDVEILEQGQDYDMLKPSYVIFLCCFDYFKQDKPIYRFCMQEEDNHLPLGDETYTIILNSRASDTASMPKELRELFQYMNESIVAEGNEFLKQLDHSVEAWNTGEGRHRIMTLEQEILIREAKARREGRAEGRTEGIDERNRAIAQAMKSNNEPIDKIIQYTGLSAEDLEML